MRPKNTLLYGSPFRECPNCYKTYIDKDYKEIAVSGYEGDLTKKVEPFSIVLLVVGPLLLLFAILCDMVLGMIFGGLMALSGLIFVISDLKSQTKRKNEYEAMRIASEERLGNIEYAQALLDLGYPVPRKYLVSHLATDTKKPS
jgi:hypothetical protein